jgi:hypothetical protein
MGLSDLPIEILEIILSYCNKDSIQGLLLVSHDLNGLAVQQLYRHILPADARQTISLLWALVQLPFAAAHVRTLHVRAPFCLARDIFKMPGEMDVASAFPSGFGDVMTYWSKRVARASALNQEFKQRGAFLTAHPSQEEDHFFDNTMCSSIPVAMVEHAFRNMTSLQKLVIHSPSHPLMWAFSYELPALKLVKIHHNAASPLLLCWLAKQPAVTSIEYHPESQYIEKWFPNEGPEVESHFLPNIREITTNIGGAVLFVPGRPVRSLHLLIPRTWKPGEFESELEQNEDYATGYAWRKYVNRRFSMKNLGLALRSSTRPIHRLGLSAPSTTILEPFLRLAIENLPAVTHLTITMDFERVRTPFACARSTTDVNLLLNLNSSYHQMNVEQTLDAILEQCLGLLPNLLLLEVPSDQCTGGPT